ncbi:Transposase [Oopsacas minuta]|uniref:Transposase n=1 Tax=Oopsacas minuta TaxID=111878 RepID=A0AAV7JE19_9METZ|nr:Transposase [Oopsacas minuta]
MYAIFFNTTGVKTVVPLEPGKTINSTWYTESCLPLVTKAINLQRPDTGLRGTFLHHVNANSHTSKMTRQFIEESGLHILLHLPYSPDLAPCHFWPFPRITKYLKGRNFSSNSELEGALRKVIGDINEKEFQGLFKLGLNE